MAIFSGYRIAIALQAYTFTVDSTVMLQRIQRSASTMASSEVRTEYKHYHRFASYPSTPLGVCLVWQYHSVLYVRVLYIPRQMVTSAVMHSPSSPGTAAWCLIVDRTIAYVLSLLMAGLLLDV